MGNLAWRFGSPFEILKDAILQISDRRMPDDTYCWCYDWDVEKHGHLESCRHIRAAYYQDKALLEKSDA